jgi:hypothetical protein
MGMPNSRYWQSGEQGSRCLAAQVVGAAEAVASFPNNNTVGGLCSCLGSEKESCVADQPLPKIKSPS